MKDYQNSIEKLQELKEFMSENEYRKSYTVITTNYVIDYYKQNNINYSRTKLMNKVNRILSENGIEEFSYFFFRKFELDNKKDSELVGV